MKKLILVVMGVMLLFAFTLGNISTISAGNNDHNAKNVKESEKKIPVNGTATSKDGCTFHAVGDYSVWSGTFTGTVTCGGPNPPCKSSGTTYSFALGVNPDTGELSLLNGDHGGWNEISSDADLVRQISDIIRGK